MGFLSQTIKIRPKAGLLLRAAVSLGRSRSNRAALLVGVRGYEILFHYSNAYLALFLQLNHTRQKVIVSFSNVHTLRLAVAHVTRLFPQRGPSLCLRSVYVLSTTA